ncbi:MULTISPECIES: hypothetical protein [Nitrosopumilus]|nr:MULTISPECIES: hypothetical protein [Nitrosopumilus]
MTPLRNNRRAISTVLTTIIILVASVVLGSGVVVYGTSLFQGGTQQEAISVQGVQLWVNATDSNGVAWGAAAVRNSGDKILSTDKIEVRGTNVPFSAWYVDTDPDRVTVDNFQAQFISTGTVSGQMQSTGSTCASADLEIDLDDAGALPALCMTKQSGPVGLNPGDRMIIYFKVPDGTLSSLDAGATSSLNIFAGKTGAPQSVTIANT